MDKNKKPLDKNECDIIPLYETLAILEQDAKLPDSKVTIPSLECVKEAKDWVDANDK